MTTAAPKLRHVRDAGDLYIPRFEVYIGGQKQPRTVMRDVTQVTFKDQTGDIESFEITVNNWDADALAFKYSDTDRFDPGQDTELWMGYHGNGPFRRMVKGTITGLRPTFPAGGQPTLTVTGLSILHKFRKEQVTHTYESVTDSEIAKQVGTRLGVKVDTKPGVTEPRLKYLLQKQEFDIVFLLGRARERGYELLVVDDPGVDPHLYFGPSDKLSAEPYELEWGRSLIQFQPNLTTANQVSEVTVRGWDPVRKQPIEKTVKRSELSGTAKKKAELQSLEKTFSERREVVTDPPASTDQEALDLAKSLLASNAKDMVKGSGSTVGLPDLVVGNSVMISGLGKRFSGRYFLTGSTHTIGTGGYTTQFECRLEDDAAGGRVIR